MRGGAFFSGRREMKSKKESENGRERERRKSVYSYVTFDCTCENCGNETSFTEKFLLSITNAKGRTTHYNVEKKVKDYITFKF